MNWQREDILEVLSWVEDSRGDINAITTELEYIVVSELFKRCADEIRMLREENSKLKNRRKKRATRKQNGVH
jgi:hypothetical protein